MFNQWFKFCENCVISLFQLFLFLKEVEKSPKISAMGYMDIDKQQFLSVNIKTLMLNKFVQHMTSVDQVAQCIL